MSATTARARRLVGTALAAAVAATTVSLVPAPASAAEDTARLTVSSTDDDVTLSTVVSSLLRSVGTTDVVLEDAGGRTWRFEDRRRRLADLATPLTFDADTPSEVFDRVRVPSGMTQRLPDGRYTVTTVTSVLGLVPLVSGLETVDIDRFTTPSAPQGLSLGQVGSDRVLSWLAPEDDGGPAVTGYVVRLFGAGGQLGQDVELGPDVRQRLLPALSEVTSVVVLAVNTLGAGEPALTGVSLPTAGTPTAVTAAPGNGDAAVTWAAPTSGASPMRYTVTATPGGATCSTASLGCTVPGLQNGTSYTFTVASVFPGGAASAPSAPVTPSTVPGSPSGLSVTGVGHDSATLRWSAPQDDGGSPVTGYTVTVGNRTVLTDSTEARVPGLSARTAYAASVVARNARGASATPATIGLTTTATPTLAATVAPRAKRVGRKAALVKVDLTRAATVTVRVVRGRLVAARTVRLTDAPTSVSVPVTRKTRPLLDGRRVALEVVASGTVLASTAGTVRR